MLNTVCVPEYTFLPKDDQLRLVYSVVDPDSLNLYPDPEFQFRIRGRIRFRIQGFDDQQLRKTFSLSFVDQKLQLTDLFAFIKDVQATGEAFSPQKGTLQKMKFMNCFLVFWVIFVLLDSDGKIIFVFF
jgi:hypothetical protein